MVSATGRYIITFNGEIYNYLAIRKELEDTGSIVVPWRGHSDTEVMLAAFEAWGIKKAVQSFVGMFAFALWDRQDGRLSLVRDRIGEKPLYYGWAGRTLIFGSDLKALRVHPAFRARINRDALALLMRYSYIPAPYCIYEGFNKLLPGTIVSIAATKELAGEAVVEPYWSARDAAEQGVAEPFTGSEYEAVSCLDELFRNVVAGQMLSDVPLGAFLSGGIDSSLVTALMQAQSSRPVKTFTIGFSERAYDEAKEAMAVARHLGTEHTELYVTP